MHYTLTALFLVLMATTSTQASPLHSRDITTNTSDNSSPTAASTTATPTTTITSNSNNTMASNTTTTAATTTGTVLPGTATNCTNFYVVQANDTCDLVDTKNNITATVLFALNTEIDSACDNLTIGQALCVG